MIPRRVGGVDWYIFRVCLSSSFEENCFRVSSSKHLVVFFTATQDHSISTFVHVWFQYPSHFWWIHNAHIGVSTPEKKPESTPGLGIPSSRTRFISLGDAFCHCPVSSPLPRDGHFFIWENGTDRQNQYGSRAKSATSAPSLSSGRRTMRGWGFLCILG